VNLFHFKDCVKTSALRPVLTVINCLRNTVITWNESLYITSKKVNINELSVGIISKFKQERQWKASTSRELIFYMTNPFFRDSFLKGSFSKKIIHV